MDFYQQAGTLALGSRLRRLSGRLTEDASKILDLYEVDIHPKYFPVFYVLSHTEEASIAEIAQIIGHSHPSVSQIVKQMGKRGLVTTHKRASDARVNVVTLSPTGKQLIPKIEQQYVDVEKAVEELLSETQNNLWKAIEEAEFVLADKSLLNRVRDIRKAREQRQIQIVDYSPAFHDDFKRLNYAWIEKYFAVEEADKQTLEHPNKKILQPGGHIFMACRDHEAVGTCALIKMSSDRYELAKMAVEESARGMGIGWLLGQAAITKARSLDAKTLCIESNTVLKPAIGLYQKLGFQKVVGTPSPYERCNIQMELRLAEK